MRVYDIALMLVRALVAIDVVRAGLDFVYTAMRYAFLIDSVYGEYSRRYELSTWLSPVYNLMAALLMYALSKPIARSAALLSASSDAATHF